MAKRLIDADALLGKAIKEKRFVFFRHDIPTDETIIKTVYKDLADFIQSAPTVDAVEVVRCKECRYYGGITFGRTCRMFSGIHTRVEMAEDGFCSYGERRTDGTA